MTKATSETNMTNRDPEMIRAAALKLAGHGLAIFPCKARGKEPATKHGLKDATKNLTKIRQWWGHNPNLNIGIATGPVSKIFVVDVDGLDAEAELRNLESEHGELPATVEVTTARGRHVYFQYQPERPVRNSASLIAPGIDVRGDGGYVLAPPSMHPSGQRYRWSVDADNAFAPAPDWLLDKISNRNGRNPFAEYGATNGATPVSEWRDLVADGAAEGCRNDSIARLTGHLLRRFIDPVVVMELMLSWNATHCMPPLSARDVRRTVNSICGRELRRRQGT